ncbi:MAG: STT3 domain-containing protein [archaeon]
MEEDKLFEERKKKAIEFIKKPQVWVISLFLVAFFLGIYIRGMPMYDHGGKPGLWDITKDDWTLGPDLDPWLFTRIAKSIVETGSIPQTDTLRNVPLGFNNAGETTLLPYMIFWTYKIVNLFGSYPVEFAAALFPVIMFALTIISFFLFVREVFTGKNEKVKMGANVIALISTFFMVVIPVFLSRTLAGIPEKESAIFFFMFLAFFFYLRAWRTKEIKKAIIYGILTGIATAGMGLISGLYIYVYVTITISAFIGFILNKLEIKEIVSFTTWWVSSALILIPFSGKITLVSLVTSLTAFPSFALIFIFIFHLLLWKTNLSNNKYLRKITLPKNITSLILSIVIIFIAVLIINPHLIVDKAKAIDQLLFHPITGRWNTTVAENRQPYFSSWVNSFGPLIGNIPIFFWMFFIGSVIMFKKMLNSIKNEDSWKLTGFYIFFFFGLTVSRYSSTSIFNGENFISKAFYLISVALFIGSIIYYYLKYNKNNHKGFEAIDYRLLFVLATFIVMVFSARGAVRLIMVLGPISTIFVGYLIWTSITSLKKVKDETFKMLLIAFIIMILILSMFSFWTFFNTIKSQSYYSVPSHYNQQWQKAMKWVRDETPVDAVFGHWWDYGYWVQSIGERATVLDGGNAITFWNYWMGRLVLTGDNQADALEFLYNHDTTHFLIDSSDIGKYSAFSSIGSDENYDRLSWIPIMIADSNQYRETSNGSIRIFTGGSAIDEDITYEKDGKKIFLPGQKAAIIGIILGSGAEINNTFSIKQPVGVFYYQGIQHEIPLRYLEIGGNFRDYGSGLNGTIKVIPNILQSGQGMQADQLGAIIYISPRVTKGFLAQKYLLDDPFNNFPNFKLVHSEENIIIQSMNSQGANLPEFINYQGLQGPIKIWEIEYTGDETKQEKYLDKDSSKYLSWQL